MPKVICGHTECKHNKNKVCKAKEINLGAWLINTVHYGMKRMEECITYEESEEYKEIQKILNSFMSQKTHDNTSKEKDSD